MARTGRRATALDHATAGDLFRAVFELAAARLRLGSKQARSLIAAGPVPVTKLDPVQSALVERLAYAIPRVAARLPWRADCMVQALAAERWLRVNGIPSTLTLGVPRDKPTNFEAHAWLTAGDRIVTGGDVSGYVPLKRA
jgi:hypothetical protein